MFKEIQFSRSGIKTPIFLILSLYGFALHRTSGALQRTGGALQGTGGALGRTDR